ncbi:hypothetical protein JXZ92_02225 [Mycoplasma sp. CSL10137]|uniref:MAG0920 family protein n=1 Tax=unclassified Mycoplasma TaxID=2683645 RepID=UPI00197B5530|nr:MULTISPECIES: hypothetical protein [unclassified Mycoplasma]MBN4083629.1 hypothetical protein [Mycoplasma sp. CSL10137]MBN4084089.1 hypothetical protein [Mycoplasma sp. CSL10166]
MTNLVLVFAFLLIPMSLLLIMVNNTKWNFKMYIVLLDSMLKKLKNNNLKINDKQLKRILKTLTVLVSWLFVISLFGVASVVINVITIISKTSNFIALIPYLPLVLLFIPPVIFLFLFVRVLVILIKFKKLNNNKDVLLEEKLDVNKSNLEFKNIFKSRRMIYSYKLSAQIFMFWSNKIINVRKFDMDRFLKNINNKEEFEYITYLLLFSGSNHILDNQNNSLSDEEIIKIWNNLDDVYSNFNK